MQFKIMFKLCQRYQAVQNTYKFYIYVTNNVEIGLWIHSGKSTAVDKILNENGKESSWPLICALWSTNVTRTSSSFTIAITTLFWPCQTTLMNVVIT